MRIILCDPETAATELYERLRSELESKSRVLWLVSGGSNVAHTVTIMSYMPEDVSANLRILPVDERFGEPGHADSNWQQLLQGGFNPKHAKVFPVLQSGQTFASARDYYEKIASELFDECDTVLAQLGMGADGHIAGILPGSPAVDDERLVSAYESQPYRRLTLTFKALEKATDTYVFAFGETKEPALLKLRDEKLPLTEQPAQFLRELQVVNIYNDQIGEKS